MLNNNLFMPSLPQLTGLAFFEKNFEKYKIFGLFVIFTVRTLNLTYWRFTL